MFEMKQVTIIGTGLLGASLALALRDRGYTGRIVGVGRREKTLQMARDLGCFDGLTTSTAEALAEGRELPGDEGHMAVLAAPLGHFEEIFTKVAAADDPGLIITDVGSTKASVCAMAARHLPDASRFVGSHPMAGSEQQGPTAAEIGLFFGKPCVVTPTGQTDTYAVRQVDLLWSLIGMRLVKMSPEEHDQSVALISHLPHAVAALLVNLTDSNALDVASTGFADTTRIAAGDPTLWFDIFDNNKPAVLESLDKMVGAIQQFRMILESGDEAEMITLLLDAKHTRDRWEDRR